MTEYLVPYASAESEFEEKRSRFISHVFLVESEAEARARIDEMKKKYYDARHNCWCFVLHDGTVRYGDDGEPQGTAGQPMLEVLKKKGIFMTAAVVTRYFGGVKLGAGGLVSAYTRAVAETVENAKIVKNVVGVSLEIKCGYEMYNVLLQALKDKVFATLSTDFADNVKMTIAVPKEDADNIEKDITCALLGQVSVLKGATAYYVFE